MLSALRLLLLVLDFYPPQREQVIQVLGAARSATKPCSWSSGARGIQPAPPGLARRACARRPDSAGRAVRGRGRAGKARTRAGGNLWEESGSRARAPGVRPSVLGVSPDNVRRFPLREPRQLIGFVGRGAWQPSSGAYRRPRKPYMQI